jgi:RNA polymerase sigma-70 factor (ECF subfamily)
MPLETHAKQEWNDEELMVEVLLGEEWAMEALYERYHTYAYSLAYRIVRDDAIADDIVQEAFVAVWHKAATYRELHGSVRAWLLAIVRNRAIDWVRSSMSRSYQCTSLQDGQRQDLPSNEPELWEEVWQRERNAILRQTLAQLPTSQRQVIELRYFEGSTDVEIAERLQIPLGTVKGRIRLGLQKMRPLLCNYIG